MPVNVTRIDSDSESAERRNLKSLPVKLRQRLRVGLEQRETESDRLGESECQCPVEGEKKRLGERA